MDSVEVSKIKKVERELYLALENEKNILESIATEKIINDETEKKLIEVIQKVVELNK
jgi:F0F1-type ATP synthase alpha subunit